MFLSTAPLRDVAGVSVGTPKVAREMVMHETPETRFRFALQAASAGTWGAWPLEGRFEADERAKAIHGFAPDALLTQQVALSAIHPEDREGVEQALRATWECGSRLYSEHRVRWPDGSVHWVLSQALLAGSEPPHVIGFVQEITDRKMVELALLSGEEERRTLIAEMNDGFCIVEVILDDAGRGVDFRFLETNPAFVRQGGFDPAGRLMSEIAPIEPVWPAAYGRVAMTGVPEWIVGVAAAFGRTYDVYAFRVGAASDRRIAVFYSDITARCESEMRLRESEARFRALVSATRDVVYRMSPDWTELQYLLGHDFIADNLEVNRSWLEKYIPPIDHQTFMARVRAAIASKSVFELEHRVIRLDGTLGWTCSRAVPVLDGNGTIREWFGMAQDITARKAAEDALHEADIRRDEFLAILGHELRNPLAAMALGLNAYIHVTTPSRRARLETMMGREVQTMQRLLDDLLDVRRIKYDHIELRIGAIGMESLLRETVMAMQETITAAGQVLHLRVPREPVVFLADQVRLKQLLSNLLSNAARFTPPGGVVELSGNRQGSEVVFRCKDTGRGILREDLETIFAPFTRGHLADVARRETGLGIGLTLARQIAQLHGGTISAASNGEDRGSEFTVRLPWVSPAGGTAGPE